MDKALSPLSKSNLRASGIVSQLRELSERMPLLREAVRRSAAPPEGRRFVRDMRPAEAAHHLGVSERWLKAQEGKFVADPRRDGGGRVYSPQDLLELRRAARIGPMRADGDRAFCLLVQNFKGGSGKSTTAVNVAQFIATKGYRVLLVDFDPQGSGTMCWDFVREGKYVSSSEMDFTYADTIGSCIQPERDDNGKAVERSLEELARQTHWQNVDVVPGCSDLMYLDFYLASQKRSGPQRAPLPLWATVLKDAAHACEGYDVVVFDTPPAMNSAMLGVVAAADGIVVPVRCAQFDVDALTTYIDIQLEWFELLVKVFGDEADRVWIRFLLNDRTARSGAETKIETMIREFFEATVVDRTVPHLEALKRGGGSAPSVYDRAPERPVSVAPAASKARDALNDVYRDVFVEISLWWATRGGLSDQENA